MKIKTGSLVMLPEKIQERGVYWRQVFRVVEVKRDERWCHIQPAPPRHVDPDRPTHIKLRRLSLADNNLFTEEI